jgi:hypothetical protein
VSALPLTSDGKRLRVPSHHGSVRDNSFDFSGPWRLPLSKPAPARSTASDHAGPLTCPRDEVARYAAGKPLLNVVGNQGY